MSEVSSHVHGDGHQERRGGRAGGVPVENARRLDDPHLTADESEVKISRASEPEVTDALIAYIDRSPLAIAMVDARTQLVRYANVAFRELSGNGSETIVGDGVSHAIPLPAADRLGSLLTQVRECGQPQCDVQVAHTAKDGEPMHWSVTIWPVPMRGDGDCELLLHIRDITEERRANRERAELVQQLRTVNERLLLASLREQELTARAETANEAKSNFLAMMSHELRTPLTAILGYEELLAEGITGPISDAQQEQLARIKRSAKHLLDLVDQVLTMARVEANRERTERAPVGTDELLDWVKSIIAPLAQSRSLAFTVRPPEHPVTLNTDGVKVRQILLNLLGNAVKFTDRGEVALGVRMEDHAVHFEVRDTGIGIEPADIEHVFDPFWQVEQKRTRKAGGSGLGLSVSQRLARLLGGDVLVESEPGHGSTFTLRLPLDEAPASTAS